MKKVSYITVVGVIALGAVIYLIWKKRKENAAKTEADKKQQQEQQQPTTGATPGTNTGAGSTGSTTAAPEIIRYFTKLERARYLRKGDSGEDIKALQSFLNKNSSYNLTVDGIFGQATENAVFAEYPITKSVTLDSINIVGFDRSKNQHVTDYPAWESLYNSNWFNY